MNVQDVFNKVIDSGFYSEHDVQLMCHALRQAEAASIISKEEHQLGKKEIISYLSGFGSLGGLLDNKNHPWDFQSRLSIYKDWANRPSLKKENK